MVRVVAGPAYDGTQALSHFVRRTSEEHEGSHSCPIFGCFHVTAVVSTAVTILVAPLFIAVAALLYTFAVRRLPGLRFRGLRTLIAGVLAFLVVSSIITALFGNNGTKSSGILPGLWFFMLGTAIALLAGMTFLMVAEAFVPSGDAPSVARTGGVAPRWARSIRSVTVRVTAAGGHPKSCPRVLSIQTPPPLTPRSRVLPPRCSRTRLRLW